MHPHKAQIGALETNTRLDVSAVALSARLRSAKSQPRLTGADYPTSDLLRVQLVTKKLNQTVASYCLYPHC